MWIIAIVAGLAAIVILALFVPLDLRIYVNVNGIPKFSMKLGWLFGLVSKEMAKKEQKPDDKRRAFKVERESRVKGPAARTALRILRARGLLKQLKLLLKSILRIPKIRDLEADLKVGLGDPADTGLLFALIGPATPFLGSSLRNEIKLQPSFADEATLEGSLHGAIRLQPIQVIIPLIRFVFSLPILRAAKILVVTKWKRNKLKSVNL